MPFQGVLQGRGVLEEHRVPRVKAGLYSKMPYSKNSAPQPCFSQTLFPPVTLSWEGSYQQYSRNHRVPLPVFYRAGLAGVKNTGGAVGRSVQPLSLPAAWIFNLLSANPSFCSKARSLLWPYQSVDVTGGGGMERAQ